MIRTITGRNLTLKQSLTAVKSFSTKSLKFLDRIEIKVFSGFGTKVL
jgi:hypothetical protein